MSLPNSTSHCLGKISPLQARGDPCSGWVNVPTKATYISFKSGSLNSFLGVLVIVTSNLGLGDFFFFGKKRFTHRPLGECPTTLWGAWTCLCLHLVSFNGDLKKKKKQLLLLRQCSELGASAVRGNWTPPCTSSGLWEESSAPVTPGSSLGLSENAGRDNRNPEACPWDSLEIFPWSQEWPSSRASWEPAA